jgi:heme/copper-type cytochrome/quinol oxidase subunit 4
VNTSQVHVTVTHSTYSHSGVIENVALALVIALVGLAFLLDLTPGFVGRWAIGRRVRVIGVYLLVVAGVILAATFLL